MEKIKITERALIQRINRALLKNEKSLLKIRDSGKYVIIDKKYNKIDQELIDFQDVVKFAGNMKILKPYEEV